ncbi:hypothetical protein ACO2Q3_19300 [Caulobacter sp. KR2-114]|uniref:hypothetical protein n=1 Tax=Caulobacter sp. KR2-114 TaxID=3400912 RepID=UPI003C0F5D8F
MPGKPPVNTVRTALLISAFGLLNLCGAAALASDSGMTFGGEAPLVCAARLAPPAASAQDGARPLGQVSEFCNDPRGFQVWVDYPETLANAQLMVDGAPVTLTAGGATRIDQASAPGQATHTLTLLGAAAGDVTVRIVPL